MANIPLTLDEKRKIIGDRLKEVLKLRNYSQAKLLHVARTFYGMNMASPQLSMIISGKRSLPLDFAQTFAKILDIEAGYLVGMDEYKAACYDEYPSQLEDNRNLEKANRAYNKYEFFLDLIGYQVSGYSTVDGESGSYEIKKIGKSDSYSIIPADEMERFKNDVIQSMKAAFEDLMIRYKVYTPDDMALLLERIDNDTLTDEDKLYLVKQLSKK